MPLFVKQNKSILYIHVPKTGGSSIEQMFLANGFRSEFLDAHPANSLNKFRRCSPQHMDAAQLLSLLRPVRIDYVFMTVRDPVARLMSQYRMRVRVAGEQAPPDMWFRDTVNRYLEDPYAMDNHIRPQREFWIPGCDIFRQEQGFAENLVSRIEQRTGLAISHRAIGVTNSSAGVAVDEEAAARALPLVRQFYQQDFSTFGY